MSKNSKNDKHQNNNNKQKDHPKDGQASEAKRGHSVPSREIPVGELQVGDRVPLGNGDVTATIVNTRAVSEQIVIPAYAHIITYVLDNGQAKGAYSYIVLGDYAKTKVCLTKEELRAERVRGWADKLMFWKK